MQQHYIAKVWLDSPMSMDEIANRLGLQDIKNYTTDLPSEKIVGRVGDRLWIIHLSWGTWREASKIKVYAIPAMSDKEADIAEEHINHVLNG